jgi:tRNA threonylcarbamoyladenosine biosynthesis protein TsaB
LKTNKAIPGWVLGIESSTPQASAALLREGRLLDQRTISTQQSHSRALLPLVAGLLKEHNLSVADIGLLACGRGPGSFTGLRVAIASALGLSAPQKIPLVGITGLLALSMQAPFTDGWVVAMLDARRGEVYAQLFRWQEGGEDRQHLSIKSEKGKYLLPQSSEMVATAEKVLDSLDEEVICLGNGAKAYEQELKEVFGDRVRIIDALPLAGDVAILGLKRYIMLGSGEELSPLYLREGDVQARSERSG